MHKAQRKYLAPADPAMLPRDWQPRYTGLIHVTWSYQGDLVDAVWIPVEDYRAFADQLRHAGFDQVAEYHHRATLDFDTVVHVVGG